MPSSCGSKGAAPDSADLWSAFRPADASRWSGRVLVSEGWGGLRAEIDVDEQLNATAVWSDRRRSPPPSGKPGKRSGRTTTCSRRGMTRRPACGDDPRAAQRDCDLAVHSRRGGSSPGRLLRRDDLGRGNRRRGGRGRRRGRRGEIFHGTIGADRLVGTPGDDVFFGYAGADRINGRGGRDVIYGGEATTSWPAAAAGIASSGARTGPALRRPRLRRHHRRHRPGPAPRRRGNDALLARDGLPDVALGSRGRDRYRLDRWLDSARSVESRY